MLQKRKLVTLLLAIAFATTLLNVKPVSSVTARLATNPPIAYAAPGETFTVNITIAEADYVYAWQVNMSFDNTILEFVNVTEGDFLKDQPQGSARTGLRVEQEQGWAFFGWSTVGAQAGVLGGGVLASVEFRVLGVGESVLGFENNTYLLTQDTPIAPPQLEKQPFVATDGFFLNTFAPPAADFTYSPEIPGINQTITFDASASSAASGLEIVEYFWDFGDGTNASLTTPTVNHTYTTGGVFTISLTVFDNATASDPVKSHFPNDTRVQQGLMPLIWYELYGTKKTILTIAFAHDIAITDVAVSKTEVTAGEAVSINVTVLNKGTEPEDFTVTAYYGTHEIDSEPVEGLNPAEEKSLIFSWDTTDVAEGDYQIKAEVSGVEGDGNPDNDRFIDGTVTVKAGSEQFPTFIIIGGAIGAVAVLVVIALFFMRRKGVSGT